jgi:hypothetical protein
MLVGVTEEINPDTGVVIRSGLGVLSESRRKITIKLAKANSHTRSPIITNTLTQEELTLSSEILKVLNES